MIFQYILYDIGGKNGYPRIKTMEKSVEIHFFRFIRVPFSPKINEAASFETASYKLKDPIIYYPAKQ